MKNLNRFSSGRECAEFPVVTMPILGSNLPRRNKIKVEIVEIRAKPTKLARTVAFDIRQLDRCGEMCRRVFGQVCVRRLCIIEPQFQCERWA